MRHGGPAFPRPAGHNNGCGGEYLDNDHQTGMTLRDYFAAAALACLRDVWPEDQPWTEQAVAEHAYLMAEAMLQEKEEWDK